jgi:hypothetical protein
MADDYAYLKTTDPELAETVGFVQDLDFMDGHDDISVRLATVLRLLEELTQLVNARPTEIHYDCLLSDLDENEDLLRDHLW